MTDRTQDAGWSEAVRDFDEHRGLLVAVAYRILGSVTDAEDVVQEAWLRWSNVEYSEVADPRAFLVRVTTRLAIDRLRRAKARRESYVGPWLPEPVLTRQDPAEDAAMAESVSMAMLVVLETLSPLERAVFVLSEVFGMPHAEIADGSGARRRRSASSPRAPASTSRAPDPIRGRPVRATPGDRAFPRSGLERGSPSANEGPLTRRDARGRRRRKGSGAPAPRPGCGEGGPFPRRYSWRGADGPVLAVGRILAIGRDECAPGAGQRRDGGRDHRRRSADLGARPGRVRRPGADHPPGGKPQEAGRSAWDLESRMMDKLRNELRANLSRLRLRASTRRCRSSARVGKVERSISLADRRRIGSGMATGRLGG